MSVLHDKMAPVATADTPTRAGLDEQQLAASWERTRQAKLRGEIARQKTVRLIELAKRREQRRQRFWDLFRLRF